MYNILLYIRMNFYQYIFSLYFIAVFASVYLSVSIQLLLNSNID